MHLSKRVVVLLGVVMAAGGAPGLQAAETQGAAKQTAAKSQLDTQAVEKKFKTFYDVVNQQKFEQLGDYIAQDMKEHNPAPGVQSKTGPQSVRESYEWILAAFPDGKFEVDKILVQGDQAAARYTFTGTHKGEFMNMQPTNKKVKVTGFDWAILNSEMEATEHWGFWDTAALMQQLRPKQQARVE